ncbi:olfactory receptor 11A1-like [Pelodiscus sinensis]|uniref:olfactory receptor 11A1-like n=1 Tax=Pelodiscus sinensis TaxID=13735 RepID=UPI003F6B6EB6
MASADWSNKTVTEFVLLGFGDLPELQILLFLLFSAIYVLTMAGNLLIVALVVAEQHLHTPMYFFLGNLSCLETCYSSTLLPRLLAGLLTGDKTVSICGCLVQYYFFGVFSATECYLLAVMSYDRYLAICKPLHYGARMNGRICLLLVAGSWINGLLPVTVTASLMSQLPFCGPGKIDHFFCDFSPVLSLSCSDTRLIEFLGVALSGLCSLPPSLLTVTSYICIITSILSIPSTTGRKKAFSTCSSHLVVVTMFYGTLMIVYLLPKTPILRDLNKVFSVFYTVLTPLVNPLIYSLRNAEVKKALRKAVGKCGFLKSVRSLN